MKKAIPVTKKGSDVIIKLPKKEEPAFKRVNVPKNAILFVVKPGEIFNPVLVRYLRSQGYELTPVKQDPEPSEGVQPSPTHAAASIYGVLTSYDPISQNNIVAAIIAQLKKDRLKTIEESERRAKEASENLNIALQTHEIFVTVTEHGGKKSEGIKGI